MPESQIATSNEEAQIMTRRRAMLRKLSLVSIGLVFLLFASGGDVIVARFNEIAKDSGGKLQVVVDKFESTSERTSGKPMPLENVYAILPGSDPKLAKTIFIVSGHFDSRPSNVMDPEADAPGADDDASGVAVSVECARL